MILKIIFCLLLIQANICNNKDQNEGQQTKQQQAEFVKEQFDNKIQDEMKILEQNRKIQRKMELEEHQVELEVLNLFKELIESKVAIVYNIKQAQIESMFRENRITQISKYKNLTCPLYQDDNASFKLKDLADKRKQSLKIQQQDNLYEQLEKASNNQENMINEVHSDKIMEALHNVFAIKNLEEINDIDILDLPQTNEERMASNYKKKIKKNDISSISLETTEDSQQEKNDEFLSDEENQQSKLEIQEENEIDISQYIDLDKQKLAEDIVWDPSEQVSGFQDFFKNRDEFNEYVGQKHIDKFEIERQLESETQYLKMLKNNPDKIQNSQNVIQDEKNKLQQIQSKSILDMDLQEFMDISQYTIRKLYEEEKLKNKLDQLNKNQQAANNNINEQEQYKRVENKRYQDFLDKHNNDLDQAEKEQAVDDKKKSYGTKFIDLINKQFYKTKKGGRDKQICNSNFKYQFLKKPKFINKNPIIVQQSMKKYCPSLMKSCCTEQEIDYLFQKAQQSVEKPIDELSNMELFFKFLKVTPLKTWKQFIIKNNNKIRKCLPQNPAILLKSLIFMQKNYDKIMRTYTHILKNTTENVYSFYCSTCNLYSQNYFQYENRKYNLNMNQKEIVNFQKIYKNSFLMHSVYAMGYFFECFQFNLHLNQQEIMSFILPNSFLSFSSTQNNPIYAYYKSDSIREFFDQNYFLYSKKLILWGNLLKLIQETLNGNSYQNRLHIFIQKSLIQPFSPNYSKFNLSNIQLQISKGNRGNIMQFNKMNTNNDYFKKQNDIIKIMLEKTKYMKNTKILMIWLLFLFFIFIFN